MDIIKHTNDFNTYAEIGDFIKYINSSVECSVVVEKIKNKQYLLYNARKRCNFPIYNYFKPGTSLAEAMKPVEEENLDIQF